MCKWLEASSFAKAVFGLGEMPLDDTPLMPASGASYAYAASFVSYSPFVLPASSFTSLCSRVHFFP